MNKHIEAEVGIELASLLAGIAVVDPVWDRKIRGLQIDSRDVQPGDIFLAWPGTQVDGRDFIAEAIERGLSSVTIILSAPCSTTLAIS